MPGAKGRADAAEPVWLGEVLLPATVADLVTWVNEGGPGVADPPVLVEIGSFSPTRQNRHELEEWR